MSHTHRPSKVSLTTVQSLMTVSIEVCKELITKYRYRLFKTCRENYYINVCIRKFLEKRPNTFKNSHAHLQCVHDNWAKFEECQVCDELITQSNVLYEEAHPSETHHSISWM
jgi:hypothetical protein